MEAFVPWSFEVTMELQNSRYELHVRVCEGTILLCVTPLSDKCGDLNLAILGEHALSITLPRGGGGKIGCQSSDHM